MLDKAKTNHDFLLTVSRKDTLKPVVSNTDSLGN